MNSSLCQNGVVLTGKDLERYSKRKGLCHMCARFKTHKRAGKLLRRNKWEPLTIKNDEGNYLVYKGHCIQPTCYTLDQAKESLGEKEKPAPRGSIRGSGNAVGISPWKSQWKADERPPATRSNESAAQRVSTSSSTGTTTQQRRESYESAGRNSPRGSVKSVNSLSGSVTSARFSMSDKWSREMPQITLPSLASSSHAGSATPTGTSGNGSATPTTGTGNDDSATPTTEEDLAKNIERELAGAISNLATSLYNAKQRPSDGTTHSRESPDAQSTMGGGKSIASVASFHTKLTRSSQDKKKEGSSGTILKKSLGIFPGLKKGLKSRKNNEEQTDDSSISSGSLSQFSISDQSQLPGTGFVVDVAEGNYRAAFEALDLAEGQASSVGKSDLKALCLQSKQLDYFDIETVAVQVDSKNNHWMSQDFVLGDDDDDDDDDDISEISPWDYDHEHKVVQDLSSGVHKVCLSNVMRWGLEELELEADLDDFEALERVAFRRSSNEFLVFRTRVALEAEIQSCRDLISKAEKSDEPTAIQNGIEARSHLNLLLPLRKFYLSRRELEKKISGLSRAIGGLHSNDLDRRYYLATQKEQLLSQIEEEKREQDILQMKARAQEKRLEGESEISAKAANSDNVSILTGPEPSVTSTSLGKQEKRNSGIYASPSNLGMDETRGEVVANMTVFQSAPLAYVDHSTGTHHVCPLLDFQYEGRALTQSLKDAESVGAKVDVEFDIATTDRLSAFLSKSESRVMHLSCHGHPQYLALENGFGGMQILPVRDLKRFIASGTGTLELVFVSACHSKAAGKAFLDAGIRHVICCRQDDKFRDEGAIEFARTFYRALALNNTLKQAFKMAREAMRISPMVKDSKAEYEKFILLPELPEDDPYHDVYIFSDDDDRSSVRRPSIGLRQVSAKKRRARILPRLPQYFVGREMDMYTILDALRSNDIVSVQGPPEVGKTSLVAAISRYIEQRHKSFLFDDVFWLPVQEGSIPPDDKLCQDMSRIFKLIKRASSNTSSFQGLDKLYADCWGRVIRQLHDKRVLLVVHGRALESPASKERLENFLRDLLKVSNCKIITVDVPVIEEAGPTTAIVDVEALDFDPTVLLFARLTRSASASTQQIVKALTAFPKTTEEPSKEKLIAWRRRRTFERIGSGFPAAIRRAALEMSDEDLTELLRLAKKPLVDVSCREDLETKLTNLECDEGVELKANNFLKARDIRETIEELQCLRQDFPTLQELREEEREVQRAQQMAIATKQYDDASRLKKVLADLQIQISKELNHKTHLVQLERMSSF